MTKIHIPARYMASNGDFQLAVLKDYLELMEAQLQDANHIDRLLVHFEAERFPQMDEADHQVLHQGHCEKFERDFPELLHRSFIVALYSVLDSQSLAILKHAKNTKKIKTNVEPPKPFNSDNFKGYMEDVSQVAVGKFRSWQAISIFAKVRHCIVHANGEPRLTKWDEAFLKKVATMPSSGIELRGHELTIGRDYCFNSHQSVLSFFDELYSSLGY